MSDAAHIRAADLIAAMAILGPPSSNSGRPRSYASSLRGL
jgi:hypothetical protein